MVNACQAEEAQAGRKPASGAASAGAVALAAPHLEGGQDEGVPAFPFRLLAYSAPLARLGVLAELSADCSARSLMRTNERRWKIQNARRQTRCGPAPQQMAPKAQGLPHQNHQNHWTH